jgi:hypothetical protein
MFSSSRSHEEVLHETLHSTNKFLGMMVQMRFTVSPGQTASLSGVAKMEHGTYVTGFEKRGHLEQN